MLDRLPRRVSSSRRGFALLITITLLAFLVLLLVSLASLTRVETQVANNSQSLSQARQNALMALNVALGELQRTAGPDQRVTATADLVAGTHPSKIRWTGVWDATNPTSAPTWLVSRANPTVAPVNTGAVPAPDADNIELVGANSTDFTTTPGNRVVVPTQTLTADVPGIGTNVSVGKYAWWVGDEGVKARVNLRDPWAGSPPATERINSWTTAQRVGIEKLRDASGTALGPLYPANAEVIDDLLQLNQLSMLSANPALGTVARLRFHDLSAHSRGVLSDVAAGGLKKDLTAWARNASPTSGAPADTDLIFTPQNMGVASPAPNDSFALPTWGLIRDFTNTRYAGVPIQPRIATDTVQGINPMLSMARVGFAVEARVGQPLKLHLFPTAVLWNPYSVPIAPGLYEFGVFHRNSMVRFNFESSPDGTTWTPGLGELWLARGNFPNPGSSSDDNRPFVFRIRVVEPIPAGESWVFSVPETLDGAAYTGTNELLRGNNLQTTLVIEGTTPVPPGTTRVRWAPDGNIVGGGELDAALRPAFEPADQPSGWPAFQGLDLRSSAYQTIQRLGHGGLAAPAAQDVDTGPLGPTQPRFGMGMMAKMGSTNYLNGRWIATANYRAQLAMRTQAEPDNPTYSLFIGSTGGSVNPAFLTFDGDRASAGRRINQEIPARNVVLAEVLPDDAPLASLAQLQHANLARLSNYPGHAVGNSHASYRMDGDSIQRGLTASGATLTNLKTRVYDFSYGLNTALWDRYFFSTIPNNFTASDLADPTYHLPNSRMRFFRPETVTSVSDVLQPEGFNFVATQVLIEGAFNINSTSVEAWRTLLASANGLAYNPETRSTGPELVNPISRFTVPQGGTTDVWAGYRSLTDTQLDQLARNIVAEVRARGPFRSVGEFVNRRLLPSSSPSYLQAVKGPLQAALDATTTGNGAVNSATTAPFNDISNNSTPTTGETTFFRNDLIRGNTSTTNIAPFSTTVAFAPGMVSQADLLNAIGPVISARSDTFIIRTYGESLNPVTGESQGRAYCEAIVQRLPDYVDTAENPDPADDATGINITHGRRFTVTGFRWLSANDL